MEANLCSYENSLNNGNASRPLISKRKKEKKKCALPGRPRGNKASKSDLKRDAATLALSETFKGWMTEKEETLDKREDK
jgi:hypothetical protein